MFMNYVEIDEDIEDSDFDASEGEEDDGKEAEETAKNIEKSKVYSNLFFHVS